jgi:hypothetical protein
MAEMRKFVILRLDDMYYTFPAFAKGALQQKKAQTAASVPSEAKNDAAEAATQPAPEKHLVGKRSKACDE